jgi:hypothetical protein
MISAGYYNQESNFVGNFGAERYNFRTNLVNEYGRLKISALMAYNRTMQNAPNASTGTLIVDGGRIPPYYTYKMKSDNGHYLINDVLSEFNPLGLLEAGGFQKKDDDNFIGSLNGELKVANGLTAKGIIGLDLRPSPLHPRVGSSLLCQRNGNCSQFVCQQYPQYRGLQREKIYPEYPVPARLQPYL